MIAINPHVPHHKEYDPRYIHVLSCEDCKRERVRTLKGSMGRLGAVVNEYWAQVALEDHKKDFPWHSPVSTKKKISEDTI